MRIGFRHPNPHIHYIGMSEKKQLPFFLKNHTKFVSYVDFIIPQFPNEFKRAVWLYFFIFLADSAFPGLSL